MSNAFERRPMNQLNDILKSLTRLNMPTRGKIRKERHDIQSAPLIRTDCPDTLHVGLGFHVTCNSHETLKISEWLSRR
jgi:hypothetical protein